MNWEERTTAKYKTETSPINEEERNALDQKPSANEQKACRLTTKSRNESKVQRKQPNKCKKAKYTQTKGSKNKYGQNRRNTTESKMTSKHKQPTHKNKERTRWVKEIKTNEHIPTEEELQAKTLERIKRQTRKRKPE